MSLPFASELAFSKPKDSVNICMTSESDSILIVAEVDLYNKSVKASFGPQKPL